MAAPAPTLRAWQPGVTGVQEVLHAYFPRHAYPRHTHATWTLLVVDRGAVGFDLDGREHGARPALVTLLPPDVTHDGHSVTPEGFRKRVLYLDAAVLGSSRIGRAVDHPGWRDAELHTDVDLLHRALVEPGASLEAESRLTLVRDRLIAHLDRTAPPEDRPDRALARRLQALLDARVVSGIGLAEASSELGASPGHLVRAFRSARGITPHRYLVGRRLDLARRLLLAGHSSAEAALESGFFDQAHLTRHFRTLLGVTPAAYAASGALGPLR